MAKFLFLGHGTLRFTTDAGQVVYVDPYIEGDYSLPADLILVTHQHFDHNQLQLVTQNPGCTVITEKDALVNGVYQSFTVGGVEVRTVPAGNKNHPIDACVGYILTLDGVQVYCAGDTSWLDTMPELKALAIDYALLPIDGFYNMDA